MSAAESISTEARERWKAANAALESIEAERRALVAPTDERWLAAQAALQDIEDETGVVVGRCEGCATVIFDGEPIHNGPDVDLCGECAPDFGDMLRHPENFVDHNDQPMTAAKAKEIADAHVAAGGSLIDKIA